MHLDVDRDGGNSPLCHDVHMICWWLTQGIHHMPDAESLSSGSMSYEQLCQLALRRTCTGCCVVDSTTYGMCHKGCVCFMNPNVARSGLHGNPWHTLNHISTHNLSVTPLSGTLNSHVSETVQSTGQSECTPVFVRCAFPTSSGMVKVSAGPPSPWSMTLR